MKSIFRKLSGYFGSHCAYCLGVIEGEPEHVYVNKPKTGVGEELLIPRGWHKFHDDCYWKYIGFKKEDVRGYVE